MQEQDDITAIEIANSLVEASASGISATVVKLIRSGKITTGTRLPKVRDLARELHVSSATVSAAWKNLRSRGYIDGTGRQGSWVSSAAPRIGPRRFDFLSNYLPDGAVDMTYASPDPHLLPDLRQAFSYALNIDPELHSYTRQAITPALQRAIAPHWPFKAQQWLAVSGGFEGLHLLLQGISSPGEKYAVADPAPPRILDILDRCGLRPVPVETDKHGPSPSSLEQALNGGVAGFIYEPRCSSLLGVSITNNRREELVPILRKHEAIVIEDDGAGDISEKPLLSLGTFLPQQTVLIRSFSKAYGPDLRIGVMGSANPRPIELARETLKFGAGWVSRILQNSLAHLIADKESIRTVSVARETYGRRRTLLARALTERGVSPLSHDGLVMSVPVLSDARSQLVLATHGYAVTTSELTRISHKQPFIRLTVGVLSEEQLLKATDAIALAASAPAV